ncbi:MAG TPA: hypothetical protein PLL33_05240 [Paracoccus sp. (in: a-proteobacteria)]|nr:hypothetical protein [Paracoccus sp. (in: a-proteobacteria)]
MPGWKPSWTLVQEDLVERVTISGIERLFFQALPIHVALLRGSTADERGNITMERKTLIFDNLVQAMASRNPGGAVIVPVTRSWRQAYCPLATW